MVPGKKAKTKIQNLSQKKNKTILNPFRMVQPLASDVNGEWLEVFQARKCSWIDHILLSGWWFGTFFIVPYIGNNHPNWLIFFRGVETTNQLYIVVLLWTFGHYMLLLPCVFFVIPADHGRSRAPRWGPFLESCPRNCLPTCLPGLRSGLRWLFLRVKMEENPKNPPVIKGDNSSNRLYINGVLMGKSHTYIYYIHIYIYIYIYIYDMICMSDFLLPCLITRGKADRMTS